MLTLGIVLAAIGIALWIIGFIAHAMLIAGGLAHDNGGFRLVLGPALVLLGNLALGAGAIILVILGIIWIVAQFS